MAIPSDNLIIFHDFRLKWSFFKITKQNKTKNVMRLYFLRRDAHLSQALFQLFTPMFL